MLLNEYNVWHNFYLNKTAFTVIISSVSSVCIYILMLFNSNCISNFSEATIQQIQKNVVACFIGSIPNFYYNYKNKNIQKKIK